MPWQHGTGGIGHGHITIVCVMLGARAQALARISVGRRARSSGSQAISAKDARQRYESAGEEEKEIKEKKLKTATDRCQIGRRDVEDVFLFRRQIFQRQNHEVLASGKKGTARTISCTV